MSAYIKQPDFGKLLDKFDGIGEKVEEVAAECCRQGSDFLYTEFQTGLARHRRTGAAMASLVRKPVSNAGNTFSTEVGSFYDSGQRAGFMHALYQEYGTPRFRADPWQRPAADKAKSTLPRLWRQIMSAAIGDKK